MLGSLTSLPQDRLFRRLTDGCVLLEKTDETPAVYHNNENCSEGKKIERQNREEGVHRLRLAADCVTSARTFRRLAWMRSEVETVSDGSREGWDISARASQPSSHRIDNRPVSMPACAVIGRQRSVPARALTTGLGC